MSDAGGPAFVAPDVGEAIVQVNGNPHAVRVAAPVPNEEAALAASSTAFTGPYIEPGAFLPLALKPSDGDAVEDAKIIEDIDLGHRLPFAGTPDIASVGEAIHRFLAADDPEWDVGRRVALAKRLLDAWGVAALDPRDVVTMGSRFRDFIGKRWPGAVLRREAPIICRVGDRTLSGRIDLVVETPEVIVVFDHKSFPGTRSKWVDQARNHAGQLRLYRDAITATLPAPKPIMLALHLPISGEVLVVEP
jgi:hypothetical protein